MQNIHCYTDMNISSSYIHVNQFDSGFLEIDFAIDFSAMNHIFSFRVAFLRVQ